MFALAFSSIATGKSVFARTFQTYRTLRFKSRLIFHVSFMCSSRCVWQLINAPPGNFTSRLATGSQIAESQNLERLRCAKSQRTAGKTCPSPLGARGRFTPGSCNGLFSLGIPYSGSGLRHSAPHLIQRTNSITSASHFPHLGQAHPSCRATGRLYCFVCNSTTIAQAASDCNQAQKTVATRLQPTENSKPSRGKQPRPLWKAREICGKPPAPRHLTAAKSPPSPSAHSQSTASPAPPAATP